MTLPATGRLGKNDVHVWLASLAVEPADFTRLEGALSEEERQRAERLRRAEDRTRFVAARGIVKHLLAAYLGEPPASLRFAYGSMGQPRLAEQTAELDLRFNLSHSCDLLLVALSRERAVGVDLEPIRRLSHREAVERRVFSTHERETLAALPDAQRLEAFFNGWTRKEAFAKAVGDGMWATMGRIEVTLDPVATPRLVRLDGSDEAAAAWTLFHLKPARGFIGALAAEGRNLELSGHALNAGKPR